MSLQQREGWARRCIGRRALSRLALSAMLGGGMLAHLPAAAQEGRTIKIGALSTLSGPYVLPESAQAAKAYFDTVNAAGGIRGRRIEYLSMDEGTTPASATAAASRLINDPEVVALAGGSGFFDCAVNSARYESAHLMSLQGASVSPACFAASHVVPLNNGPFTGLASAVLFAHQSLRSSKLCAVALDLPGMVDGYRQALERLAAIRAIEVPLMLSLAPGQDPAPLLRTLQERRCDTVVFTGTETAVLQWSEAVQAQGVKGVTWIYLTPAYTDRVTRAFAQRSDTVYVMAEFEPWKSRSLPLQDWRRLMQGAQIPLSSLSQGGYVAAQLLVRVLRGMDGPITRETVTRALQRMSPVSHPLLGMPFEIGDRSAHNPNRAALPLRLREGYWHIATPQWIEVPDLSGP